MRVAGGIVDHEFHVEAGSRFNALFLAGGMGLQVLRRHDVTGELDVVGFTHSAENDRDPNATDLIAAETAGTYVVRVSGTHIHPTTGRYRFAVMPLSKGMAVLNRDVVNTLDAAGDTDEYEISIQAGESFNVQLALTESDGNALRGMGLHVLRRHDVTGELERVASTHAVDGERSARATAPIRADRDATYVVQVVGSHIYPSSGRYRFLVRQLNRGSLAFNAPRDGNLDAEGDADEYVFRVPAGESFRLQLGLRHTGGPVRSAQLTLFRRHPATNELTMATYAHASSDAREMSSTDPVNSLEAGEYVVRIAADAPGPYRVLLTR
jgi:hypothetical protein